MPGSTPRLVTREVGGRLGRANHQPRCWVAISEPMTKNSRVTSIRALPPPAVNRVPEAQPPPSCMPMPNRKAPITTEVDSGETLPRTASPNRLPAPRAGKNSSTARASITI